MERWGPRVEPRVEAFRPGTGAEPADRARSAADAAAAAPRASDAELSALESEFFDMGEPRRPAPRLPAQASAPDGPKPSERPLQRLLQKEAALTDDHHITPYASGIINEAAKDALAKSDANAPLVPEAKSALEAAQAQLPSARAALEEARKSLPRDSKLPAAQSAYNESIGNLSLFYQVRAMDPEQRQEEAAHITNQMASLAAEFNSQNPSNARKAEINRKMESLTAWKEAILADPVQDDTPISADLVRRNLASMLLLAMASGVSLQDTRPEEESTGASTAAASAAEPQVASNADTIDVLTSALHDSSKQLFGPKQDKGAETLAKNLMSSLSYSPTDKSVASQDTLLALTNRASILNSLVSELRTAASQTTDPGELNMLNAQLKEYGHESNLLTTLINNKASLDEVAPSEQFGRLNAADQHLRALEQNVHEAERTYNTSAATQNIADYNTLASALTGLSEKIREHSSTIKALDQKQSAGSPLTPSQESSLANAKARREELTTAFMTTMHQLEVFDNQKNIESKGSDPYTSPSNTTVDNIVNKIKGVFTTTGNERPSKAELRMRYDMAMNGFSGVSEAYAQTGRTAASQIYDAATNRSPSELMSNLSLDNLYSVFGDFKNFSTRNPVLARELAANLMHTYSLLSADPSSGVSSILQTARTVLDRRTAENMTSDILLGQSEHLYSRQGSEPLTPAQIAFIDLAGNAPYIAGAYIGASGGNFGGSWAKTAASWIPFIGSYAPVQALAGAGGGIAEVRAQKELSASISRNHEVLANSIRTGFNAFNRGEGISSAFGQSAMYVAKRDALQTAGDFLKTARESDSIADFAKKGVKSFIQRIKERPVEEAAKAVTAGGIGVVAGAAVAAPVMLITSVAALPLVVAGTTTVAVVGIFHWGIGRVLDYADSSRVAERLRLDTRNQLEEAAKKLPTLSNKAVRGAYDGLDGKVFEQAAAKPNAKERDAFILSKLEEKIASDASGNENARLLALSSRIAEQRRASNATDPAIDKLQRNVSELGQLSNRALIDSKLDEMGKALPPSEIQDDLENQLREEIQKIRKSRSPITEDDIRKLSFDITTLRVRQMEAEASANPELANALQIQGARPSLLPFSAAAAAAVTGPLRS